MHELSLADALFDQIDAALAPHPGAVVRLVRLQVGALAGLEPELFVHAFEDLQVPRGHPKAELQLTFIPAVWSCPTCAVALAPDVPLACPACGIPARLTQGGDLILERIEFIRDLASQDPEAPAPDLEVPDV